MCETTFWRSVSVSAPLTRRHDIQHNGTQHNMFYCDTQHKTLGVNITCHYAGSHFIIVMLNVVKLSVIIQCIYAERHYPECHYPVSLH